MDRFEDKPGILFYSKLSCYGMDITTIRQKDRKLSQPEIEYQGFKFLITDSPSDKTIHKYIRSLKKSKVTAVVRVCQPAYQHEQLDKEGFEIFDFNYPDGTYPSSDIISAWFKLLKKQYLENPEGCVAIHCLAGLGRAPVMVAIALIELGLEYEEAVELIREKRRGAINSKQLAFLEKYRPKSRLSMKHGNHQLVCCLQ